MTSALAALLFIPIGNIFICYSYISTLYLGHNVSPQAIDMSQFTLHRVFRDMGTGAAFYPLLAAMPFLGASLIFSKDRKLFSNPGSIILFILLAWILVSGVVNTSSIMNTPQKLGRTGLMRFALQFLSISFFAASYQLIYLCAHSHGTDFFDKSRRAITVSFWVVAAYVLIVEIPTILGIWEPSSLIAQLKPPPACQGRVQGLTAEPSWMGVYLAFATPWVIFSKTRNRIQMYLTSIALALITFFTYSRSSYAIVFVEFALAAILSHTLQKSDKRFFIHSGAIFLTVFVLLSFSIPEQKFTPLKSLTMQTTPFATSNKTRLGTQMAGLKIAFSHPFFGVGLGQASFALMDYMPDWAVKDNLEVQEYLRTDSFGIIHGLHSRIAAESGWVGLSIWLTLWIIPIYHLLKNCIETRDSDTILLLTLLTGVFCSGFVVESFKFFESSFALAYAWAYVVSHNKSTPDANRISAS